MVLLDPVKCVTLLLYLLMLINIQQALIIHIDVGGFLQTYMLTRLMMDYKKLIMIRLMLIY